MSATVPVASFLALAERVQRLANEGGRKLVLIGGCSRSGKTTLAHAVQVQLAASGRQCKVLGADCWIVDAAERKAGSTVADRFEGVEFERAVEIILSGGSVSPPVYDAASRRRIADSGSRIVQLDSGILIAEGVIGLFRERLRTIASLQVYVDLPDDIRRDRLVQFYRTTKGFSAAAAAALIEKRESDEVVAVRTSARDADVIVRGDTLFS